MSVQTPVRPSPEERLRLRYQEAERYMRGDIDADEFEQRERQYMPDYHAIMRTLVKSQSTAASILGVVAAVPILVAAIAEGLAAITKRAKP